MTFHDGDLCLVDNSTMHTILKEQKYFEYLKLTKANVTTISGLTYMIQGYGRANTLSLNNTKLGIKDALYSPKSRRNLLIFKYIHVNGYHIETIDEKKRISLYYFMYFRQGACT